MLGLPKKTTLQLVRNSVQILIALLLLWAGFKFYRFVAYFESMGATVFTHRPPVVEAFLPISAFMSLKLFLITGMFDRIHPAGLTIFLLALLLSFFFRKAFCSWICPIGTISEGLGLLGAKFLIQVELPTIIDRGLMLIKYLILAFFVKIIVVDMSAFAIAGFLNSPYNRIADVKMLKFFTEMSTTTAIVLLILAVLSLFIRNFWCRYLCPYGALLGVISFFSPTAVARDKELCIDCAACTKACPSKLQVAKSERVASPECTGCLRCLEACPQKDALKLKFLGHQLEPVVFGLGVVLLLFGGIAVAKLAGYWQTSLSMGDYAQLILNINFLEHP